MAKVTRNSDKEVDVFKTADEMNGGEIGVLNGYFVIKLNGGGLIDVEDGNGVIVGAAAVRILRPEESITLRNEG